MFDLAAAARSESLSWNRAWGRGSLRATGEGGQRPWSAAGAGRTRAVQGELPIFHWVGAWDSSWRGVLKAGTAFHAAHVGSPSIM